MHNKLLSISIASYNTEKFVESTVGSCIIDSNDINKLEIIIVNDGSKDRTSQIAHELAEKYPDIVVVIDKVNGGYGSTINASLSVARGKYYKLLDGDDWFNTSELSEFLSYLDNFDSDLIISPYYEVNDDKRKIIDNHKDIPTKEVELDNTIIGNKQFAMHEIAIKTDILKKFDRNIAENCFYTDSEYVFYCIISSKTFSRFEKPIYLYRLGREGQSVSLEGIRKHYKDLPVVAERIMSAYVERETYVQGEKKKIINYCVEKITYNTYRSYMLLERPLDYKEELMDLDKSIKNTFPIPYSIGYESKLVSLLRNMKFHFYILWCHLVIRKFYKEIET